MRIRIAQRVPNTQAEGPGRRYALWVQGCPIRCVGCCNPEMFGAAGGHDVEVAELLAEIASVGGLQGLTLLGGEPFAQAAAVAELAAGVRALGLSIMVFSGYTLAELSSQGPDAARLLSLCDLLVDGKYDAEQPETGRRWIGSRNQIMHFLTARYAPTEPQFRSGNTVEIRLGRGALTVNGWPAVADALRPRR